MNEKEKKKQLEESYSKIFKALKGLSNEEAIGQLECAKIDIILNDSLIILDGKSGVITEKINKWGRKHE